MKNTTEYNFLDKSPDAVSDVELLSLITGKNSQESLRTLLQRYDNNMSDLRMYTSYSELIKHGITHSKAIALLASFQIEKRVSSAVESTIKITSSRDSYSIMKPVIGNLPHEEFWIAILNRSFILKNKIKISLGGLSGTVVDTQIIGKRLIENYARAMIAFHNHPSGNIKPSEADISITQKIKKTADMLDVQFLDHIIVTSKGYFSFADEGLLL